MSLVSRLSYGRYLIALAGAALCATLALFKPLPALQNLAFDSATAARAVPAAPDIVILAIDDRSLLELGRWPWPREKHVEMLRLLDEAGVRAVGMDILFSEPDVEHPGVDELLAQAIATAGNVVLPVFMGRATQHGQLLEFPPVAPIRDATAALGHVHVPVAPDGIVRRLYLREGLDSARWPHFAVALAGVVGQLPQPLPGDPTPTSYGERSVLRIERSNEVLLSFVGPAGAFQAVSYVDLIRGRIEPGLLSDKIVLVGATASGHGDKITTPVGRLPGVELNANILQALRTDNMVTTFDAWREAGAAFVVCLPLLVLLTRLRAGEMLVAVLVLALAACAGAYGVLEWRRQWVSPVPFVVTVLLFYPLWNWVRLAATARFMSDRLVQLTELYGSDGPAPGVSRLENGANLLKALGLVEDWNLELRNTSRLPGRDQAGWRAPAEGEAARLFAWGDRVYELRLLGSPERLPAPAVLERLFPEDSSQRDRNLAVPEVVQAQIQELGRAMEQADQHRARSDNTLEQLTTGIVLAAPDGELVLLNHTAAELLGLDAADATLLTAIARLEPALECNLHERVAQLLVDGMPFEEEGLLEPSGRDVLVRAMAVGESRRLLLFSVTDVTPLKASERRRTEALSFVSHDLRAPLTSILALLDGARGEQAPAGGAKLLDDIEKLVSRNLSYAENFIQLSRLEAAPSVDLQECELQSLIDNAVAQVYHAARGRDVRLQVNPADDPLWIACDRVLLERAVLNLVDNAVKHSPAGSVVHVTARTSGEDLVIAVRDSGPGVEPELRERVFEAYRQGPGARRGVGLGLRFVHRVAQLHGGAVELDSVPGEGSEFRLRIPMN